MTAGAMPSKDPQATNLKLLTLEIPDYWPIGIEHQWMFPKIGWIWCVIVAVSFLC